MRNEEVQEVLQGELSSHGFVPMRLGRGIEGFGKVASCQPQIVGTCEPIQSHLECLDSGSWFEGSLLFAGNESPRFVLWEQFFCLETPDLPRDLLSFRDYFDYGIEPEIQRLFVQVSPILGPAWRYLFPCKDFVSNLRSSIINVASPIIGNAINSRSDDLNELLAVQADIKTHLATRLPIPMIWAFPDGLPIGPKDNFFDLQNLRWYTAGIKSEYKGDMSMVDFRPDEHGVCSVMQHDFNSGTILPVEMKLKDITIEFAGIDDQFRSRRKLSRLKINYLW